MTRTTYPTDLTDAVGKTITLFAKTFTIKTAQVGDALNYQRYVLHSQVRVSMANASSSAATVANSLFPFQKVESLRYMAYDSSSTS